MSTMRLPRKLLLAFKEAIDWAAQRLIALTAILLYLPYLARHYLLNRKTRRLHIGCGKVRLQGWINADINPRSDLIIDIRWRLPFPSNFLERIYSEHVIEHVSYDTAVSFLREAHRVLSPNGVIRIATPDLDDIVDGYSKDWRRFDWTNWPEFRFIKTRAQMLNIAFRWWGHQHLFNREELECALKEAGFDVIRFAPFSSSNYPDLTGLETRKDSKLIAEAVKQ